MKVSQIENPIETALKKGYSKGYAAGLRRVKREENAEQLRKEKQAFLDQVYLALLPSAMLAQNWTMGEEKVTSTEQRITLCISWAQRAVARKPRV